MRVYVDERAVECATSETDTVADLVGQVRARVSSPTRVLVGISADGEDITGDDYAETLRRRADSFSRFDFLTGEPRQLVRDALPTCTNLLDEAELKRRQVIERLTQGQTADGLTALGACCSAWRQVHETIAGALRFTQIDADAPAFEGRLRPESLADVKQPLIQVREALQARDFVLISDVLQYEFDPIIENWRGMLSALQTATDCGISVPD